MIELSKLSLKNFLSHVDTSLLLDDYKGLVLIEGQTSDGHYSSNGSGKSTILEGIVYALTGDTLRGVSVNDVVNRNIMKNTSVSLDFLKDRIPYSISRYRKDDIMGDNIVIKKDGENISKRVNKETQKLIDDTLDISYKILTSTVLLGEGLSSRFTQLSDPEKKSLIESTLNLNYDFTKIRERANNKLKTLRVEVATLEGEINAISELMDIDVEKLKESIKDNRECLIIYEGTIAEIKKRYEEASVYANSILPKIYTLKDSINRHTAISSSMERCRESIAQCQREIQSITSRPTPSCPLCHQSLENNNSLQQVIDKYSADIQSQEKELYSLEEEIKRLPEVSVLQSKVDSLSEEYTAKSIELRDLLQQISSYEVKIAETLKDIESMESTIQKSTASTLSVEEKKRKKDELSASIDVYDYYYKLFSPTGIIVNILYEAIDYINSRLATYSEVLLEKDYKIQFLKGKISLVDNKGSSYQSLSNGEKRRLDIAIQFSLHDYCMKYCGIGIDTMFIDEILDTLDDIGIENIITVLRLKLDYCNLSRIFVISHNSELKSYFDRVVTVVKDMDGNSRLKID